MCDSYAFSTQCRGGRNEPTLTSSSPLLQLRPTLNRVYVGGVECQPTFPLKISTGVRFSLETTFIDASFLNPYFHDCLTAWNKNLATVQLKCEIQPLFQFQVHQHICIPMLIEAPNSWMTVSRGVEADTVGVEKVTRPTMCYTLLVTTEPVASWNTHPQRQKKYLVLFVNIFIVVS